MRDVTPTIVFYCFILFELRVKVSSRRFSIKWKWQSN